MKTPKDNSIKEKLFDNLCEFEEYYLIKDNCAYKFFIGKLINDVIIRCENYEIKLNANELSILSRFIFDNINEVYDYINNIFKNNKVKLNNICINKTITLIIKIYVHNEEKDIELILTQTNENKDLIINEINKNYKELKNEINYLKNEILSLKNEILNLKSFHNNSTNINCNDNKQLFQNDSNNNNIIKNNIPFTYKNNNIIYYNENINYMDSDINFFEKQTHGAFIFCNNLESLKLLGNEILIQKKKNRKIIFYLITTGNNFDLLMKNCEKFKECFENICIYCKDSGKYKFLREKYKIIHDDIYTTRDEIIKFIEKYSSNEISHYPLIKLITYQDYLDKYKFMHQKISKYYGDLSLESFNNNLNEMKSEESNKNELISDKNQLVHSFLTFEIKQDIDINMLNQIIIKEYSKNSFFRDLNKWLGKYNLNESVSYFAARLMYSLNSYAKENHMFSNGNKKTLYRGVKMPYSSILEYEKAKGKIIFFTYFLSTSEDEKLAVKWSGRPDSNVIYKTNMKFSVVIYITNIYNKNLISNSISIQKISMHEKEKEHVFLPFSFYYVRDVKIDIKKYTADIYLESIGKKEILEEIIKKGKEIKYNEKEKIME